ncbi:MAG TPA: permease [Sedimentisphaerales bacterium]|nr:permease [Sedimentisphaerales bacterium]
MDWRNEWKKLAGIIVVFLLFFWLPVGWVRFTGGIMEALHLMKWYAREHVLLCLVPAFFIAGAIGVFISQASVMKYLGAKANKVLAYGVAAVSGSILAVCSCTVLPLFAGIWRMGAGLGPATAFLYSGPAINVLAIILTARILGIEIGIARAVGAISFSVIIGLIMHLIYRKEEMEKATGQMSMPEPEVARPLWKNAAFFAVMIGVLVFANWGSPNDFQFKTTDGSEFTAAVLKQPESVGQEYLLEYTQGPHAGEQIKIAPPSIVLKTPVPGSWTTIWQNKWLVTAGFSVAFGLILVFWIGVKWWKVVLAAIPPALLALVLPMQGLWILLPFSAGIVGVSIALASSKGEGEEWFGATWTFAKQILPLLFFGVLVAGFLLGRPDHEGLIPSKYVEMLVGDSPNRMLEITGWGGGGFESFARAIWPLWTNFFASIFGAFMYFATLTEVPILQGLMGSGMGKGPALALLLAGPALSLPSMLVIAGIMGVRKTAVFTSLVVVMATISGMIFGAFF